MSRRRRLLRPVGGRRRDQGHGPLDGGQADHLRHGQSRSRDHARGRRARSAPTPSSATGRSDYPNQINNVLGFPYIFRGALDVQATEINDAMKIAAAVALAELARLDVPDQVAAAYAGKRLRYGPDYIIPAPFDPRLISQVPAAVAKAAMDSGVARRTIVDMEAYKAGLAARLDPVTGWLQTIFENLRRAPKRVVFAEGEEETVARAANAYPQPGSRHAGPDRPWRAHRSGLQRRRHRAEAGVRAAQCSRIRAATKQYADFLYGRLQRLGYLRRDCLRMVHTDRNIFGACMVALGHADAMVTGVTRNWSTAYEDVRRVLDPKPGHTVIGLSLVISRGRTILVADTSVHDMPTAEQLANIAVGSSQGLPPLRHRAARGDARLLDLRAAPRRTLRPRARGRRHPHGARRRFRGRRRHGRRRRARSRGHEASIRSANCPTPPTC